MGTSIEELNNRLYKLEKKNDQEVLTLIEMLSNASFFGDLKKTDCGFARNGQCGFFILQSEAKKKIPIVRDCRISGCNEPALHCHIELSNITCAFCQRLDGDQKIAQLKAASKKKKVKKAFH